MHTVGSTKTPALTIGLMLNITSYLCISRRLQVNGIYWIFLLKLVTTLWWSLNNRKEVAVLKGSRAYLMKSQICIENENGLSYYQKGICKDRKWWIS